MFCNVGVWKWSQHPNYAGNLLIWYVVDSLDHNHNHHHTTPHHTTPHHHTTPNQTKPNLNNS